MVVGGATWRFFRRRRSCCAAYAFGAGVNPRDDFTGFSGRRRFGLSGFFDRFFLLVFFVNLGQARIVFGFVVLEVVVEVVEMGALYVDCGGLQRIKGESAFL